MYGNPSLFLSTFFAVRPLLPLSVRGLRWREVPLPLEPLSPSAGESFHSGQSVCSEKSPGQGSHAPTQPSAMVQGQARGLWLWPSLSVS